MKLVSVEPTMIGGVNAFIVTPKTIPQNNRDRVLLHMHGGVRVFNPGEAGTREGIMMAVCPLQSDHRRLPHAA